MRVALVGPYPGGGVVRGGVESSFVNLVGGLSSFPDLQLDVVTFSPGESADADGVRVHRLSGPRRLNNLTLFRQRRRVLARMLREIEPDVVHAQETLGYGYACLKTAGRAPVVVSIHGIVREELKYMAPGLGRVRVALADVAIERYCVGHARYLVEPTTYPREYFGRLIRGHIADVGNGIDDLFFTVEPAPEPGRVLYAGSILARKRLVALVEAIGALRSTAQPVTLAIAGGIVEPGYAARVEARVQELGLGDVVTFLGPLPPARMADEYRRASIMVLPAAQETSPMVIGEAMAVGVPVVATDVGGIPYLVDDGGTGYVVPLGDGEALARRMAELLRDEQTRRAFSQAARSRAEERFRMSAVAARVRAVYELAVGEARGSS